MYQIDELIDNQYKYIYESENVQEIDRIAFKLTLKGIPCRILFDDIVLIFLRFVLQPLVDFVPVGISYSFFYEISCLIETVNNCEKS